MFPCRQLLLNILMLVSRTFYPSKPTQKKRRIWLPVVNSSEQMFFRKIYTTEREREREREREGGGGETATETETETDSDKQADRQSDRDRQRTSSCYRSQQKCSF